ncbi:MAG: restriction endonuclease [Candidatus Delongbacteria bacterium]|nr:restriction endonuclease [Candidatus Delongbacteria bacterium]MBN2834085.1 restriction endonuclease [Candidatus Delongbacteria bacterium]
MELPKFNETFLPIIDILKANDIISGRKLIELVIEKYYSKLPQELLDKTTKSGDLLIENRINWGKSYLKKGGLVHYPQRGYVQITEKGRAYKNEDISIEKMESDVVSFYNSDEEKKVVQNSLNSSPQDLIDTGIEQIERNVKIELLTKLKTFDPYAFEKVVLILLKKMGYGEFVETSKSRDGGIDGVINEDQLGLEKIYIQAKRFTDNKVRETDIRNFIGAMSGDTTKGIFVTTTDFDDNAKRKAKEAHHKIILIDGIKLVELMYKFGVGVQLRDTYEIKAIDNDFFEIEDI